MENQNPSNPVVTQETLPGALLALIFGIISLVFAWYFWIPFVGLVFNIATLVFAIVAMKKGGSAVKLFNENPGKYRQGHRGMANTGKILGIIGLILNIIFLILAILWTFIWGAAVSSTTYYY